MVNDEGEVVLGVYDEVTPRSAEADLQLLTVRCARLDGSISHIIFSAGLAWRPFLELLSIITSMVRLRL